LSVWSIAATGELLQERCITSGVDRFDGQAQRVGEVLASVDEKLVASHVLEQIDKPLVIRVLHEAVPLFFGTTRLV
jgi:hypothetical protein